MLYHDDKYLVLPTIHLTITMLMMTPGPTEVPKDVREALGKKIQNPEMDEDFTDFYHSLEDKLKEMYGTEKDMIILSGEGILGLEASLASTIEEGDEVLCISNGIYGDGFADFVEMYGGEPIRCSSPYDQSINEEEIKESVDEHDFKAATMVHCETPTGTLNDLGGILTYLEERYIFTIVDAVSSLGGTAVPVDPIDICIGGSQKCFSSPPGLTTLSVSERAWEMVSEKEDQPFYASLAPWRSWIEDEYFPYTPSVSNLYALDRSMDRILEEGLDEVYERHETVSKICRERGRELGLEIYPEDDELSSPTVTAFHVPGKAKMIKRKMKKEKDILIATSLGELENEIIRVGHMGYNADIQKVERTMDALEDIV